MSSTLNHTIETAKNSMDSASEGAERAHHPVSTARATWWNRVKTVTDIVTMLRGFQTEDALGWFGLARRRSPFLPIGIFGAGVLVGASAGVLFAPMSGPETRRLIVARFAELKQRAGSTLDRAKPGVGRVGEPADELAGKVIIEDEPHKPAVPHNGQGNGTRLA